MPQCIPGVKYVANPKSKSLMGDEGDFFARRIFYGFRSLCTIPLS
jgi:hypothetical protein